MPDDENSTSDFMESVEKVKQLIKEKEFEGAAKEYNNLRNSYSSIVKSDLPVQKKKKMYKMVSDLYSLLKKASEKSEKSKANIKAAEKSAGVVKKQAGPKDKVLLSEAISDIDNEVEKATNDKQRLAKELLGVAKEIGNVQNTERKLRDQISVLVDQEAELNTKRLSVKERMNRCQEKIAEMLKIKEELRTI